mmetsp:Transcript_97609/g.315147  ORF Transcript_97609/g.315147 Transcript_97609/m.315147 type:complete len:226 (+) Transcript_97609:52-729(+)
MYAVQHVCRHTCERARSRCKVFFALLAFLVVHLLLSLLAVLVLLVVHLLRALRALLVVGCRRGFLVPWVVRCHRIPGTLLVVQLLWALLLVVHGVKLAAYEVAAKACLDLHGSVLHLLLLLLHQHSLDLTPGLLATDESLELHGSSVLLFRAVQASLIRKALELVEVPAHLAAAVRCLDPHGSVLLSHLQAHGVHLAASLVAAHVGLEPHGGCMLLLGAAFALEV